MAPKTTRKIAGLVLPLPSDNPIEPLTVAAPTSSSPLGPASRKLPEFTDELVTVVGFVAPFGFIAVRVVEPVPLAKVIPPEMLNDTPVVQLLKVS